MRDRSGLLGPALVPLQPLLAPTAGLHAAATAAGGRVGASTANRSRAQPGKQLPFFYALATLLQHRGFLGQLRSSPSLQRRVNESLAPGAALTQKDRPFVQPGLRPGASVGLQQLL